MTKLGDRFLKILEKYIQGKENNPDTCEDGLYIGEDIIAVLDGVTAKSTYLWNGVSSGCYGKNVIIDFLKKQPLIDSPEKFFMDADRQLKEVIDKNRNNIQTEDYPRVSIILYNDRCREIWSYGDCQCRINDKIYSHEKEIDRLNAEMRAFYLEYCLLQGRTLEELICSDPGRKEIEDNLLRQLVFENKAGKFGYPVLNGQGIEEAMIKRYSVMPGDQIVLASDGYPKLKKTLKESEDALKEILENDPICFREFRSTKGVRTGNISFDDRTYCRILVE